MRPGLRWPPRATQGHRARKSKWIQVRNSSVRTIAGATLLVTRRAHSFSLGLVAVPRNGRTACGDDRFLWRFARSHSDSARLVVGRAECRKWDQEGLHACLGPQASPNIEPSQVVAWILVSARTVGSNDGPTKSREPAHPFAMLLRIPDLRPSRSSPDLRYEGSIQPPTSRRFRSSLRGLHAA